VRFNFVQALQKKKSQMWKEVLLL